MSKNILDYFPNGWTPSTLQRQVLKEVQHRWNSSRVLVLKLETSSGKTPMAICILRWAHANSKKKTAGGRLIVPTNNLVDQCEATIEGITVTKAPGNYRCETRNTTCGAYASKQRCRGCIYNKSRNEAKKAPITVSTYHMSKALYEDKEVIVVDESHRLGAVIRDIYAKQIFPHRLNAPREIVGDTELTEKWVSSLTSSDFERMTTKQAELLSQYQQDIKADVPLNFYSWGTDFWSNGGEMWGEKLYKSEATEAPVLKQQPLDIFTKQSPFWKSNQKLVLMSATIGRPDLYELGLDRERPIFIEGDPPISPDRNPIIKDYVGAISFSNQKKMIEPLTEKLLHYLNTKKGKGVIHITYGLANLLRPYLNHDRLITHTPSNMRVKLKEFLNSEDKVFMVSGMSEGISLDYNKADWQVITKIAWPSLNDPLQRYRSKDDPDYYLWSTVKTVVQTCGRICRRPDDFGCTHILDSSFERLLSDGRHLIPRSFLNRIVET